jgi:hypothetical protein
LRVGLHDAESEHFRGKKKFPNYALMKISAWHKARGDTVEWWKPLGLFDRVYSSKVFDFTPENPYLPPDTVKGGTGYGLFTELPPEVDAMFPDYSIYPECDYAIGYLTRGCPNRCRWCIVPKKEGNIRPYRAWRDLVRPDTDKLVLMDNNILLQMNPNHFHVARAAQFTWRLDEDVSAFYASKLPISGFSLQLFVNSDNACFLAFAMVLLKPPLRIIFSFFILCKEPKSIQRELLKISPKI